MTRFFLSGVFALYWASAACGEFYRGELNGWATSPMTQDTNFAYVYKVTLLATNTDATSEYKFDALGDWNLNWGAGSSALPDTTVGNLAIVGGNLNFAQTPRHYTFQMSSDHLRHVLMSTTNAPVSLLAQTNNHAAAGTNPVLVTISLSAPRSDNERVWVRYSTNLTFAPNHLTLATGIGTIVTAQLPARASGGTVYYYVLSSTMPSNVIQNGTDADLCTLRGLNVGPLQSFAYTVQVATASIVLPLATNITSSSATLGATITSTGGGALLERGTVWSTQPVPTMSDNRLAEGGTATGAFSHVRTGWPAEQTIYFSGYAVNQGGTSLTATASFVSPAAQATPRPSVNCGWQSLNPYPQGEDYRDVAFGAGYFVMAGLRGTMLASTNGAWPWFFLEGGVEADISAVLWDGSRFVATAPGYLLISSNALNWTAQAIPSFSSPVDIAYGNGRYVVVQGGGNILSSTDTVSWTSMSIPGWAYGVIWGNNEFMAVGSGSGNIMRSPDGLTWVTNQVAADYFDSIQDVAWSPAQGRYVAVGGTYGGLYASANGSTWTTNGYLNLPLKGVTWSPTRSEFVAVGESNSVVRSANGLSWLIYTPYDYPQLLEGIAWGNGHYVTAGSGGALMTSTDALNWVTHHGAWTYAALRAAHPFQGRLLIAGDGGTLLTSTDGYSLSLVASGVTNDLLAFATNSALAVAVGNEGRILTSANGTNWTARTSPVSVPLRDAIWFGQEFLAVGNGGTLVTSTNGTNWTTRSSGVSFDLHALSRNLSTVVGVGATGRALVSTNGVNWTEHLVASGVLLTDVTWDGGRFYAVGGSSRIYASLDGRSWSTITNHPTAFGGDVLWTGDQLVRVDDNGRTSASYDGNRWWSIPGSFSTGLYGLTVFSNRVFAVGGGGKVLANWLDCSDVRAWINDSPDPVRADSNLVYTVTVTNFGNLTAADVTVVMQLAAGLSNTAGSVSQGSLVVAGSTVTAYFGTVETGFGSSFSITTTPTSAGVLTGGAQSKAVEATTRVLVPQYYHVPTNTDAEFTMVYNGAAAGGPGFTTPLFNRTNYYYDSVVLTGVATGVPTVAYTWRFNGSPLLGETGTSYSIANVQSNSAGLYELIASNIYGLATSRCTLVVTNFPAITVDAQHRGWYFDDGNHTSTDNSTRAGWDRYCIFSSCYYDYFRSYLIFNMAGQPPVSNATLKLEVAQVVASSSQLTLYFYEVTNNAAAVEATQTGNLVIYNDLGDGFYTSLNVDSNTAPGTVLSVPLPVSAVNRINTGGSFVLGITGSGSLSADYWARFSLGDEARVHQLVMQQATPPTLASSPQAVTGLVAGSATFCASGNSAIRLYYQWQENGTPLNGATNNCLTVSNLTAGMDGYVYSCVLSNLAGAVTSSTAALTVAPSLLITPPLSTSIEGGSRGGFRPSVQTMLPTTYQWQRLTGATWVDVPGAIDPEFLPNPAVSTDSGSYRLLVGNAAGTLTSATATLTVTPAPYVLDLLAPVVNGSVLDMLDTPERGYLAGSFNGVGAPRRNLLAYDPVSAAPLRVPDFNGQVRAAVSDGQGGWYVGGDFTTADGYTRLRLARIKPDGSLDLLWRPSVNNIVYALDVQGGVVYVGGSFNQVNGLISRSQAAAFDATNGAVLAWAPRPNGTVLALRADANRVYMGGNWTTVETNIFRRYLTAWDRISGALSAWAPNPNNMVLTLDLDGSKLYAGGFFTSVSTNTPTERLYAAAYDLTTLNLNPWSPAINGTVRRLLVHQGSVFAAGDMSMVNTSTPRFRVAALDATTAVARAWQAAVTTGSQPIYGLAAQGGSLYLVGGHGLTNGAGTNLYVTAADLGTGATLSWNASPLLSGYPELVATDGQRVLVGGSLPLDSRENRSHLFSFQPSNGSVQGWTPAPDSTVRRLLGGGNAVWAGGDFNVAGGTNRLYMAGWDATSGALLPTVVSNLGGSVHALARDGTNLLVGGSFVSAYGQNLARVQEATGQPEKPTAGFNSTVNDLLIQGTNVFAAGSFSQAVVPARNGALFSTNGLQPLSIWPDFNGTITALTPDHQGGWFAGGNFTIVGGYPRSGLVHLLANGSVDTAWTNGCEGTVYALANDGTHLYVGGYFFTVAGASRSYLARFTLAGGTLDGWAPNPSYFIYALQVTNGTLYAGGSFGTIASQSRRYAASFDTSTGALLPWNPWMNSTVRALVVDGSTVYLGGEFNSVNTNVSRSYLAAVDATSGQALAWTNDANSYVLSMAMGSDGLYVGGYFNAVAAQQRSFIAKIDRVSGTLLPWSPVLNNIVYAVAVAQQTVYVGGDSFANFGSLIALDTATGSILGGPGVGSSVQVMALQSNLLAVGGNFQYVSNQVRRGVVRLDRTTLAPDLWNPGFGASVQSITDTNGLLYAGGSFTNVGASARRGLAVVHPGSGVVLGLTANASGTVNSVAMSENALILGGSFTGLEQGADRINWARVDKNSGNVLPGALTFAGTVNRVRVVGSNLWVGGSFSTVGGFYRPGFAILKPASLPTLSVHPVGTSVVEGASAAMRVEANSDSAFRLVWQTYTGDAWIEIAGSGSNLLFNPATMTDSGTYRVLVGNAAGSITSAVAMLHVIPTNLPIVITVGVISNGPTQAEIQGFIPEEPSTPVTQRGICWSPTPDPDLGQNVQVSGSGTGTFNAVVSGLIPGATYHARAFAQNMVGPVYGSNVTWTVPCFGEAITGLVVTASNTTSISLAWPAMPGATGYRLQASQNIPNQGVFISQYYEGLSSDRWIELYNGGSQSVNLTTLALRLGAWNNERSEAWKTNGAPNSTLIVTGSVAAGGTYLIRYNTTTSPTNTTTPIFITGNTAMSFNGDDSLALYTGVTFSLSALVDVIGLTGSNLVDVSVARRPEIGLGTTQATDFNPAEWTNLSLSDVNAAATNANAYLGWHTNDSAWSLSLLYSNLVVGGSPVVITGLQANSAYTFSVWTTNSYCTSLVSEPFIAHTAAIMPDLRILGTNGLWLADGAAVSMAAGTDFGGLGLLGETGDRTLWITNTGVLALTLSTVTLTGDTADFTVLGYPSTIIPGGRSNLLMRFDPSALGLRTAVVEIASNDPDTPLYSFAVAGTGLDVTAVTTAPPANLTVGTASGGGHVLSDGGSPVTARGLCWSTSSEPTLADACTTNGAGTGLFSGTLTGLIAGQSYFVRAYAINGIGTFYGTPLPFTALCFTGPPINLVASGIGTTSFTASWSAQGGALGYRLDVSPNNTFVGPAPAAVVLFRETMGTVGGTTSIAAHEGANGFDNDSFTMSAGGAASPADLRATSVSTTYTDGSGALASGAANVFFTSTSGDYGFALAGIPSGGYSALTLSFGYRKESAATNATFAVEWSTNNGTAWNPITISDLPAPNAGTGWTHLSNLTFSATGTNLSLRWVKTGAAAFRIDDVVVSGVPSASPSFVAGYNARFVTESSEMVTNLVAGTTYYFRVSAIGAQACASGHSATQFVTTVIAGSDQDNDQLPDWWESARGLNPAVSNAPAANADGDSLTDWEEYIADTHPTNGLSLYPLVGMTNPPPGTMVLVIDLTSTARLYGVYSSTNLMAAPQGWTLYPPEKTGTGSGLSFTVTNSAPDRIYRTGVRLP